MSPYKVPTREEALLAFRAGVLAGTADRALARMHLVPVARKMQHELTSEVLEKWREEVLALGVPAQELDLADQIACDMFSVIHDADQH